MFDLAEARRLVGCVYCPVCKQDTLPLPSGICGFCDSQLVGAKRISVHGNCEQCGKGLPKTTPWNAAKRRFCSDKCRWANEYQRRTVKAA